MNQRHGSVGEEREGATVEARQEGGGASERGLDEGVEGLEEGGGGKDGPEVIATVSKMEDEGS